MDNLEKNIAKHTAFKFAATLIQSKGHEATGAISKEYKGNSAKSLIKEIHHQTDLIVEWLTEEAEKAKATYVLPDLVNLIKHSETAH